MLDEAVIDRLEARVLELLQAREVYTEFELIRRLRREEGGGFSLADDLALFRTHFLLFHVLYRLRDRLRGEGRAELAIGPMRIALEPYRPSPQGQGLAAADPLRDYYLDLNELTRTGAAEVAELLAGFWQALEADAGREQALAVLGLSDPVDHPTVKRRYRELAMRHHPDRGGETERLQQINHAMRVLDKARP